MSRGVILKVYPISTYTYIKVSSEGGSVRLTLLLIEGQWQYTRGNQYTLVPLQITHKDTVSSISRTVYGLPVTGCVLTQFPQP